jgi:hypothetical protein
MQDTTEEQRPPGPIAVEEPAKDGALWRSARADRA